MFGPALLLGTVPVYILYGALLVVDGGIWSCVVLLVGGIVPWLLVGVLVGTGVDSGRGSPKD